MDERFALGKGTGTPRVSSLGLEDWMRAERLSVTFQLLKTVFSLHETESNRLLLIDDLFSIEKVLEK